MDLAAASMQPPCKGGGHGVSPVVEPKSAAVRVFLRVRPFNDRDLYERMDPPHPTVRVNQPSGGGPSPHTAAGNASTPTPSSSTSALPRSITVLDPSRGFQPKDTYPFDACLWSCGPPASLNLPTSHGTSHQICVSTASSSSTTNSTPRTPRGSTGSFTSPPQPHPKDAPPPYPLPTDPLMLQSARSLFQQAPPEVSQAEVYACVGAPVLTNALDGYNGCILAYGQTGSGKTHTMMGSSPTSASSSAGTTVGGGHHHPHHHSSREDASPANADASAAASTTRCHVPPIGSGIVPRMGCDLFERLRQLRLQQPSMSFRVECSYLEIYNERVFDLLSEGPGGHAAAPKSVGGAAVAGDELRVRQDPVSGPFVDGLTTHAVCDEVQITALIRRGNNERHVAATRINDRSSRSHAIMALLLTQTHLLDDGSITKTVSKVNLVDLAGSERTADSGVAGHHFREATKINLSLTTLGRVIDALADRSGPAAAGATSSFAQQASASSTASSAGAAPAAGTSTFLPPYRESLLTWLLMDSLGGNSRTSMVCTISPASSHYEEMLSTLRYACRAKEIVNVVAVNEDPQSRKIRELQTVVDKLRRQLAATSVPLGSPVMPVAASSGSREQFGRRSSYVYGAKKGADDDGDKSDDTAGQAPPRIVAVFRERIDALSAELTEAREQLAQLGHPYHGSTVLGTPLAGVHPQLVTGRTSSHPSQPAATKVFPSSSGTHLPPMVSGGRNSVCTTPMSDVDDSIAAGAPTVATFARCNSFSRTPSRGGGGGPATGATSPTKGAISQSMNPSPEAPAAAAGSQQPPPSQLFAQLNELRQKLTERDNKIADLEAKLLSPPIPAAVPMSQNAGAPIGQHQRLASGSPLQVQRTSAASGTAAKPPLPSVVTRKPQQSPTPTGLRGSATAVFPPVVGNHKGKATGVPATGAVTSAVRPKGCLTVSAGQLAPVGAADDSALGDDSRGHAVALSSLSHPGAAKGSITSVLSAMSDRDDDDDDGEDRSLTASGGPQLRRAVSCVVAPVPPPPASAAADVRKLQDKLNEATKLRAEAVAKYETDVARLRSELFSNREKLVKAHSEAFSEAHRSGQQQVKLLEKELRDHLAHTAKTEAKQRVRQVQDTMVMRALSLAQEIQREEAMQFEYFCRSLRMAWDFDKQQRLRLQEQTAVLRASMQDEASAQRRATSAQLAVTMMRLTELEMRDALDSQESDLRHILFNQFLREAHRRARLDVAMIEHEARAHLVTEWTVTLVDAARFASEFHTSAALATMDLWKEQSTVEHQSALRDAELDVQTLQSQVCRADDVIGELSLTMLEGLLASEVFSRDAAATFEKMERELVESFVSNEKRALVWRESDARYTRASYDEDSRRNLLDWAVSQMCDTETHAASTLQQLYEVFMREDRLIAAHRARQEATDALTNASLVAAHRVHEDELAECRAVAADASLSSARSASDAFIAAAVVSACDFGEQSLTALTIVQEQFCMHVAAADGRLREAHVEAVAAQVRLQDTALRVLYETETNTRRELGQMQLDGRASLSAAMRIDRLRCHAEEAAVAVLMAEEAAVRRTVLDQCEALGRERSEWFLDASTRQCRWSHQMSHMKSEHSAMLNVALAARDERACSDQRRGQLDDAMAVMETEGAAALVWQGTLLQHGQFIAQWSRHWRSRHERDLETALQTQRDALRAEFAGERQQLNDDAMREVQRQSGLGLAAAGEAMLADQHRLWVAAMDSLSVLQEAFRGHHAAHEQTVRDLAVELSRATRRITNETAAERRGLLDLSFLQSDESSSRLLLVQSEALIRGELRDVFARCTTGWLCEATSIVNREKNARQLIQEQSASSARLLRLWFEDAGEAIVSGLRQTLGWNVTVSSVSTKVEQHFSHLVAAEEARAVDALSDVGRLGLSTLCELCELGASQGTSLQRQGVAVALLQARNLHAASTLVHVAGIFEEACDRQQGLFDAASNAVLDQCAANACNDLAHDRARAARGALKREECVGRTSLRCVYDDLRSAMSSAFWQDASQLAQCRLSELEQNDEAAGRLAIEQEEAAALTAVRMCFAQTIGAVEALAESMLLLQGRLLTLDSALDDATLREATMRQEKTDLLNRLRTLDTNLLGTRRALEDKERTVAELTVANRTAVERTHALELEVGEATAARLEAELNGPSSPCAVPRDGLGGVPSSAPPSAVDTSVPNRPSIAGRVWSALGFNASDSRGKVIDSSSAAPVASASRNAGNPSTIAPSRLRASALPLAPSSRQNVAVSSRLNDNAGYVISSAPRNSTVLQTVHSNGGVHTAVSSNDFSTGSKPVQPVPEKGTHYRASTINTSEANKRGGPSRENSCEASTLPLSAPLSPVSKSQTDTPPRRAALQPATELLTAPTWSEEDDAFLTTANQCLRGATTDSPDMSSPEERAAALALVRAVSTERSVPFGDPTMPVAKGHHSGPPPAGRLGGRFSGVFSLLTASASPSQPPPPTSANVDQHYDPAVM